MLIKNIPYNFYLLNKIKEKTFLKVVETLFVIVSINAFCSSIKEKTFLKVVETLGVIFTNFQLKTLS